MVSESKYRITGRELIETIDNWEHLISFKVNLIGCGVTAFAVSKMDPEALLERYAEAAKYDLNPEKMMANFIIFAEAIVEKSMVNQSFLEKTASYK